MRIETIPATIERYTEQPINEKTLKRVAGYARVSTDMEDQKTSYESQVDYYTKYIKGRQDWQFVKVYTDEGISGTNTTKRKGFQEMIQDAMDGKIDLIITKSVSRFARNTVDSLTNIRQLKEKGVEVYFEKENIWTLDTKGELLITIMSSLAQEESRSISENITWGKRKDFADGKYSVAYSHFIGYDKGPDGKFVVNKKEAEVVKLIFRLFLEGYSLKEICKELMRRKIKTAFGLDTWNPGCIHMMLKNEKYKGDAILQKTFTVDYLTKKSKKNEGEVPQYYIHNAHEAIIPPEVFDKVQLEMKKRREYLGRNKGEKVPFANSIVCGECGAFYGRKVWHANVEKYRKQVYRCNDKYRGDHKCTTPNITPEEITKCFARAAKKLYARHEKINAEIDAKIQELKQTQEDLQEMRSIIKELERIDSKPKDSITLEEAEKFGMLMERKHELEEKEFHNSYCIGELLKFKADLKKMKYSRNYNNINQALWETMVECMTINSKDDITIKFRNGSKYQCAKD